MTTYRLDNGTEVEVEYVVESHGSAAVMGLPWESEPAAPTIVASTETWDMAGNDLTLSDAERERIETEIAEQIDSEPVDDYYYPDE